MQPENRLQPQTQVPQYPPHPGAPVPEGPPGAWGKRRITIILLAVVGVAVVAGLLLLVTGDEPKKDTDNSKGQTSAREKLSVVNAQKPATYAGHQVHDACNLLTLETVKKNIEGYEEVVDALGTDKKVTNPLFISHQYIDRDIPAPLGTDGQPRRAGITLSEQGVVANDLSSFISVFDSHCQYEQGEGFNHKVFAKVYVTQKPTPASSELHSYLESLPSKGGSKNPAGEGVIGYAQPGVGSDGFYSFAFVHEPTQNVALIKIATRSLIEPALVEIGIALASSPKGAMDLRYPAPYHKMLNPCLLFTAEDFARFSGKPASALAGDTSNLMDIDQKRVQRSCERLEITRLKEGEISQSKVTLHMARSAAGAKQYLESYSKNEDYTVHQVRQKIRLGDRVIVVEKRRSTNAADKYQFLVQSGEAVIEIALGAEASDKSADEFVARVLPAATSIVNTYEELE